MSLKDGQDRRLARRYDFKIARCLNAKPHYIKWDVKKHGDLSEYRPFLISFSVDLFRYRAYKFTLSEFESWSFEDLKISLYKKGIYKLTFKALHISTFGLSANFKDAMEFTPITLSMGFTKSNSCNGSKLIFGSEFMENEYIPYYYNTGYKQDWYHSLSEAHKKIYKRMSHVLWEDWDPIGYNVPEDEYSSYEDLVFKALSNKKSSKEIEKLLYTIGETYMGGDDFTHRNNEKAAKILFELGGKFECQKC